MATSSTWRLSGKERLRFRDIPRGFTLIGSTADGPELIRVFGAVPPSSILVDKYSFTLIYRFPRSGSVVLERAMLELAHLLIEGAEEGGMEVDVEEGRGRELLVLKIGRILHPSERGRSIASVLKNYSRMLEENVAAAMDLREME